VDRLGDVLWLVVGLGARDGPVGAAGEAVAGDGEAEPFAGPLEGAGGVAGDAAGLLDVDLGELAAVLGEVVLEPLGGFGGGAAFGVGGAGHDLVHGAVDGAGPVEAAGPGGAVVFGLDGVAGDGEAEDGEVEAAEVVLGGGEELADLVSSSGSGMQVWTERATAEKALEPMTSWRASVEPDLLWWMRPRMAMRASSARPARGSRAWRTSRSRWVSSLASMTDIRGSRIIRPAPVSSAAARAAAKSRGRVRATRMSSKA
jgi:hypothetical protein